MVDPEGSRKLTAILAADVAGYSRLMQGDDRATVATLEAYRGIFRDHIEASEGRVTIYAELGRQKEARAEVVEILRLNPRESLEWLRETLPFKNQTDLDRFISGLQTAGLK